MINANFFWHGPSLSLYESACLKSFVRQGIEVRLHTFNEHLRAPEGVKIVDARLLADESEVLAYTQGGHAGSIAAFTDIFRYRVLQKQPGWWFDTDVVCLKDGAELEKLQAGVSGILVGEEAQGKLNGAVLYVGDTAAAAELERLANAKGFVFEWGDIGPQLITQYLADRPERVKVAPPSAFYPVHYLETAMLLRQEDADECQRRVQSSVCVHLWNEFLRRWEIPKNMLPPEGSFLHRLFTQLEMTVAADACLPPASFEALRHNGDIGRVGTKALRMIKRAKQIKETMVGR